MFKKYSIYKYFILILVTFIFSNKIIVAQNCDWSTLNDANQKYESGNFDEVLKILGNCINSGFDEKQKVQAYRLSAKTYLATDKDSSAMRAISELLKIETQFQPDYLTDPLKFIQILEIYKEKGNEFIVTSVSKKAENINQAPAFAILISEKQIQRRGYLDLEALVHDLPGFDISRSNGNLYTHAYQRGYRSINTNRTLFLIDGVEENDLWSSNVYLSRQYSLSNVKNVEIIYGPASTMYGSNAFLGVINVITKEPFDYIKPGHKFGAYAKTGYGSYNTKYIDASIAAANLSRSISFSITGRVFYSDEQDLSKYPEHDFVPISLTTKLDSIYRSKLDITKPEAVAAFLLKYPDPSDLYTISADNKIRLTDKGVETALQYDNDVYNKTKFSDKTEAYSIAFKMKIHDFNVGVNYWEKSEGTGSQYTDEIFMNASEGALWRPIHTYFYLKYEKSLTSKLFISNNLNYKIHTFNKDNAVVRYSKKYSAGSYKLENLIAGKIPSWDSLYLFQKSNQVRNELKVIYKPISMVDIIVGMETRFSSIQGDYSSSAKNDAEQNGNPTTVIPGGNQFFSRDFGLYSQTSITPFNNLKATIGVRYDNNLIRTDQGYGNVINPRFALVYFPKSFIIKLIYATAFKDATNREKYSTAARKRELPNPDLQPEKVKNYEIMLGKTFFENLTVNVSGYFSEYSNIIQEVRVQKPDSTFTNQNQAAGRAKIYGINSTIDYKLKDFSAYFNYTYTQPYTLNPVNSKGEPIVNSQGKPYKKLRISDISEHLFNIGINYDFKNKLNIDIRSNFVGSRKTGEGTTVPSNNDKFEAYAIFNGAISYSPKNIGFTIQFSINNILDKKYYSPGLDDVSAGLASKLYQNGRNMYFTLIYQY